VPGAAELVSAQKKKKHVDVHRTHTVARGAKRRHCKPSRCVRQQSRSSLRTSILSLFRVLGFFWSRRKSSSSRVAEGTLPGFGEFLQCCKLVVGKKNGLELLSELFGLRSLAKAFCAWGGMLDIDGREIKQTQTGSFSASWSRLAMALKVEIADLSRRVGQAISERRLAIER